VTTLLADALRSTAGPRRPVLEDGALLSAGAFTPFLTTAELMDDLRYSLITSDYLTVFREGALVSPTGLTTSRQVLDKRVSGMIEAQPVMDLYAAGSTLQFRYIDHWKLPVREFLSHHGQFPGAETLASVFAVPPHTRPLEAHTEGAHLFIAQLDGRQDIMVGDPGQGASPAPAFLPLEGMQTQRYTVTPGDLLHVPHGWPYYEETADEASLHLAISVKYPGAKELTGALSKILLEGIESSAVFRSHHRMPPAEKSQQVITVLTELLADLDPVAVASRAESQ
jgi:ribosomal protein L16 Arg81 hydroxylase